MNEKEQDESFDPRIYESLSTEEAPPPGLENKVIAAIRKHSLFANSKRHSPKWKLALAAAACALFFVTGIFVEKYRSRTVSMSANTYVLFLVEDERFQNVHNETELKQRIDMYRNWAIGLRKEGKDISGVKLQDEVQFLNSAGGENHPPSGIAGYFLIDAHSLNEAMQIARSCPHLKFGGQIELRRIHPV